MYTEFIVGDRTYKLRLTTKGVIQLERRLGKNPLQVLTEVTDNNLPRVEELITILHMSLLQYQSNIKETDVYEIFDSYIEEGNTIITFVKVIADLYKDCGLIPKSQTEETEETEKND